MVLALGAIGFGMATFVVYARDTSALLPQDNSTSSDNSLGLAPSPPVSGGTPVSPSSVPSSTTPAATANEPSAPLLPEGGPSVLPTLSQTTLPYTPLPVPSVQNNNPADRIIQMPVDNTPPDMSLPKNMIVAVSSKYVWGPADVSMIQSNLGIPPAQVTAHCHLSMEGIAIGDESAYTISSGAGGGMSAQSGFRYGGTLSDIKLMPEALCDIVPLPPNHGWVIQYGNKYLVHLQETDCGAPPLNAHSLTLTFNGHDGAIPAGAPRLGPNMLAFSNSSQCIFE
jgi:hypothetical protein